MKNSIKKAFAITALAFAGIQLNATDLCVAENGTGGCYATITDALNAAVSGDRILVNPKSGGASYTEDLNITKSIQILSNVEAQQFTLQGNVIISPAIGRSVIIVGMNDLTGSVYPTGNSPAGNRCIVRLMNCNFGNGSIKFDYDNFDVAVVSCVFGDGSIALRYGKVIGNDITTSTNASLYSNIYYSIGINTDASPTLDTVCVIGNKIVNNCSFSGYYNSPIFSYTSSQFFYISNNLMSRSSGTPYSEIPIYTFTSKNSLLGRNTVVNNTANYATRTLGTGINIYGNQGYVDVYNNIILATSATAGIAAGPQVGVSFNFMNNPLTITGVINDGTNNLSSNTTLNASGKPNSGSDAINGGDPDKGFYDINLTVNDAGAYGGSLTLDNYFPVSGAARVYMINAPRKVVVGSTLNVTADGFDR